MATCGSATSGSSTGRWAGGRFALTALLLLSGAPEAVAQARWTDPPTRTAAPPDAPASQPEGGRTASTRPPRRSPAARLRPSVREAARHPTPRLRPRRAAPPRLAARGAAPRPAPVPRRRVAVGAPRIPAVRADPWSIRLGPWAGDVDCSGPGTRDARRGACPFVPSRDPAPDAQP